MSHFGGEYDKLVGSVSEYVAVMLLSSYLHLLVLVGIFRKLYIQMVVCQPFVYSSRLIKTVFSNDT